MRMPLWPGFLLSVLLLATACATTGGAAASSVPSAPAPKAAEIALLSGEQQAPDFTLTDAEGREVRLASYRGQTVWLSFWATWCQSCKQEMLAVGRLKASLSGKPFAVLAVNTDGPDRASEARSDARALGLDYPILFDPDGRVLAQYNSTADLPFAVLIDAKGRIRYIQRGFLSGEEATIDAAVRRVLGE